ncbi:MAG: response regulator [Nitrospirota bacterium]
MTKVLVVDDNEKNLKLLRVILQHNGCEVIEAANGKEGVFKSKEHAPHLIFMDIQMPVMDGISALKILRSDESTRHIPVIALTSYAMKGDMERIIEEGFNGYIAKPISAVELVGVIRKYIVKQSGETI